MAGMTIAIIGAGFSGSVLALHLQALCPAGTRICLIEQSGTFGPGLAHATNQSANLLNVTAGRMSAYPDRPHHFLEWLQQQPKEVLLGTTATEEAFVPRRLFGAYISSVLQAGKSVGTVNMIEMRRARADVIRRAGQTFEIDLSDGRVVSADKVVLATGNGPTFPPHAKLADLAAQGLWQADPWRADALAGISQQATVLIIGTGLSMVDIVLQLLAQQHAGRIITLSRNGLLPATHLSGASPAFELSKPLPADLTPLFRYIRRELHHARCHGLPWHSVIDTFRPFVPALWRGLTLTEKRRFIRHIRPLWDIHRHRMPQSSAERITAAIRSGQMQVLAGRITDVAICDGRAEINYSRRGEEAPQRLLADRVLNCTGPSSDVSRSRNSALLSILEGGLGRPDALNMGFDVDDDGRVIGRNGLIATGIYAIGPLTRGTWWDITAVPNIRERCRDLASVIASECQQGMPSMIPVVATPDTLAPT